jgi:hypothetical protein
MRPTALSQKAWFHESLEFSSYTIDVQIHHKRDSNNNPHIRTQFSKTRLRKTQHTITISSLTLPHSGKVPLIKESQTEFSLNWYPGKPLQLRVQHRSHTTRNCKKLEFLLSQPQGDVTEKMIVLFLNGSRLRAEAAQRLALCTLEGTTSTREVPSTT